MSSNEWKRNRYKTNPEEREKQRLKNNRMTMFYTHGMTRDEYDKYISGNCEVCGDKATCIDHDHACPNHESRKTCTDCRRGALCTPCNYAAGFLRDDPDIALMMYEYLSNAKDHGVEFNQRSNAALTKENYDQ